MVEHWIFSPAAQVQIPPKSWEFFQPNLLCSNLCYGFYAVRQGLNPRLDLILHQNGLILRRKGFQVIMTSSKRMSVSADKFYLTHSLWVDIHLRQLRHGVDSFAQWQRFDSQHGGPGSDPTRVMGFFQPNLLCFVLCYGIHVNKTSRHYVDF